MMLPLYVDDKKNKLMFDDSIKNRTPVGVVNLKFDPLQISQLQGKIIGVGMARPLQENTKLKKNVILIGNDRFKIHRIIQEVPYVRVEGERLKFQHLNPALELSLLSEVKILGLQWIKKTFPNRKNVIQYLCNLNNLDEFLNFIASYLVEGSLAKQKVLEYDSLVQKFTFIYNALVQKLEIKKLKVVHEDNVIKFPTDRFQS